MKRYVVLLILTIATTLTISTIGNTVKSSIIKVGVTKLQPISEVESVVCTGQVENVEDGNVYAPANSISKKIYIKAGQKVNKGQALMTVAVKQPEADTAQEAYAPYLNSSYGANLANEKVQTLTAPVSGIVSSVSVFGSGYYVDPTRPAITIHDSAGLQVRLNVNESQIADIKTGQKAEITGAGFKNSQYSGTVKEISSEAKQIVTSSGQETVVEVLVNVDHPKEDMKPGFTAKAKIVTSSNSSVLVAPYSAVQADNDGSEYVLRVVNGKASKAFVQTGREFDSGFEITSGVSKGDKIVTDAENISADAHVVPISSKAVTSS